ncbi:MAG: hypothetical protein JRJ09_01045 [Deltaproteobacteria bacterium]|nr:hypothetical protein [Deltaproteobacteria bacterium]MBW2110225.1 hypothetical protein [Deltaproteobacteria bacterium]MBW2351642.1 hypothetical protein [Deltaproteobacteria bacterium]
MVQMAPFKQDELLILSDALDIAEDATGDFFKLSTGQWKRYCYDVKTLSSLTMGEISDSALAVLSKGRRILEDFELKTKDRDFYFICLQDHLILRALKRDRHLSLLPFLVYILTHELVHIVRFCNFFQRFDAKEKERLEEEERVHSTTFEILKDFSLLKLDYVLDSYQGHRMCQIG